MNSFANTLLVSSCAAYLDGPNIFNPSASNLSTTPSESGTSGPTTVKSIPFSLANFRIESTSSAFILTASAILFMPALPIEK
jgi:hypothetical protein